MLVIDMLMLRAILFRKGCNAVDAGGAGAAGGGKKEEEVPADGWVGTLCHVSPCTELNLFSCLSHVAADTLRSLTQVVVGTVIMAGGPSEVVDASGTLAISAIILLGAAYLVYEVARQCRELFSPRV